MISKLLSGLLTATLLASQSVADGLLDGRIFTGMIGPAGNPDLNDSLTFSEGQFWSDICTRCGFVPGPYNAFRDGDLIRFSGRLESDTRGQFDYTGVVHPDGRMVVDIAWEKERWYWTTRRDIRFEGIQDQSANAVPLQTVLQSLAGMNPDANPQCARF